MESFSINEVPYNFNDVPTIKKFYLSNKKIKAIIGPYGCFPEYCEYLSFSDGEYRWKKIKDFQEGEKIAVYDLETKGLRFEKPLAYVKLPMNDLWIHIHGSKFFEAVVSPEHVFPYIAFHSGKYEAKTITELIRWGITNARVVNTFRICGETFGLDEWLVRFIAMLSADGHKCSNTRWQISLRRRRKIERLEFLCRKVGVPYSRKVYNSRPTENVFTLDLSSHPQLAELTKKFPNYFYNLSSDLLDVLVDEILYWDGSFYNGNDRRYFTTIKENAEFIQYASHATNRRASILKVSYPKDNWKDGYIIHISGKGVKKTCFIDKDAPKDRSIRYISPKEGEFKYCFTTSTGFFLVRFNGAVYTSGNSGKSSGCVITMLRHTCEQMPDPHGVRRTRWVIVRNCYSDDTEILTEKRGWVLFKDLLPDDKVAQYNPATDRLEFVKPTYYYCSYYKGEMIGVKSQNLDLLVTPDHKLYVSTRHTRKKIWGDFKFMFAKDCYGKGETIRFRITAPQVGVKPEFSKDFFEFLGFLLADGYFGKYPRKESNGFHYRMVLIQSKYLEYAKELLYRNGFEFSEHKYKNLNATHLVLKINDRTKWLIDNYLLEFKKGIPSWVKSAPPDYLKAFLYGYQMGDGSFKIDKHTRNRLVTNSAQRADDLHEIAVRAGIPAICHKFGNMWDITLLTEKRASPVAQKRMWYKQDYEGMVYCVEVPTHIILVRRNGKPVLCSQTYRQLKDTTKKTIDYWLRFAEWRESEFKYILKFRLQDNTIVESEWLLRALDRPEHIANLLSLEITGAWLNEAREIPKEIFDAIEGRLRYPPTIRDKDGKVLYGPTWLGILLDTNPPDEDHWFYKYFEENRPEKAEIYHQPSGLSPEAENIRNLPPNYYQDLCVGKDQDWIDVYVHGKYGSVRSGKPVFSLYNDEIHCAKEPLAPLMGFPLIIGMDFGLTPAAVILQKPPRRLFVLDEVVVEEPIDVIEFIRYMLLPFMEEKEFYRGKNFIIVGDPAGKARSQVDGRSVFEAINQLGLRAYPAYTNSLQIRLNAVNQYLTRLDTFAGEMKPAFLLSPTCRMLRQAMKGKYRMKRVATGTDMYSDVPVKDKWSHVADALQYGALGYRKPTFNAEFDEFSTFSEQRGPTHLGAGIY